MKKLLLLSVSCLILFACKKESPSNVAKDATKYDVTFAVSGFTQEVTKLGAEGGKKSLALGDTLKNYADNLTYRVYNSGGTLVNTVSQVSTASDFGTLSDKLATGTYDVIIVASKGLVAFTDGSYSSSIYYFKQNGIWNDMFVKRFKLTVGTTAITQQVRLDRDVSGLEVTIEDAIPSNVAKIRVTVQSETRGLYADGHAVDIDLLEARYVDYPIVPADYGVKGKKFFMYVANTVIATGMTIRAYDSANTLIVQKPVLQLTTFQKNKKVLLSGSLFPTGTTAGFSIVVDPTWGTSTPVKF